MASRKAPPASREIYQIKITLRDSRPPIWRRLLVSPETTLERLHAIIQVSMGWFDSHLHQFEIDRTLYGQPEPLEDETILNEAGVRLHAVLGYKGAKAKYTYDFGDGWEHQILVEKVMPPENAATYPVLIAGKRRCPPEDCGGVGGYTNLLKIISDPEHEDHDSMLEWLGEGFDPLDFSVEEVNEELTPFRRSATKRAGGHS